MKSEERKASPPHVRATPVAGPQIVPSSLSTVHFSLLNVFYPRRLLLYLLKESEYLSNRRGSLEGG